VRNLFIESSPSSGSIEVGWRLPRGVDRRESAMRSHAVRLLKVLPVLAALVLGGCCCSPCGWLGCSNAVSPCCPCGAYVPEAPKDEKKK
jgi:hypothetical protein